MMPKNIDDHAGGVAADSCRRRRKKSRRKRACVCDLPATTSGWPSKIDTIYKLFKIRKCTFDIDTILWPANKNGVTLDNWFAKVVGKAVCDDYYDIMFTFLDDVFKKIDIDDLAWYRNTDTEDIKRTAEVLRFESIKNVGQCLNRVKHQRKLKGKMLQVIEGMQGQVFRFINILVKVLRSNRVCEKTYQEFFKYFIEIIGFTAYSGECFSKLTFEYDLKCSRLKNFNISSLPDLLLYNTGQNGTEFPVAVVKVKKDRQLSEVITHGERETTSNQMSVGEDTEQKKEDLSDSEDDDTNEAVKRRKIKGTSEDSEDDKKSQEKDECKVSTSYAPLQRESCTNNSSNSDSEEVSVSNSDSDEVSVSTDVWPSMKADYPNGNPEYMTEEEQAKVSSFLPQLIGDVAAAAGVDFDELNLQTVELRDVKDKHIGLKSILGIGVVGFNIYVVNFMCVSRDGFEKDAYWKVHLIPCTSGIGIDVLVSRPLNILKRVDRNKLFKFLYAMQSIDYV